MNQTVWIKVEDINNDELGSEEYRPQDVEFLQNVVKGYYAAMLAMKDVYREAEGRKNEKSYRKRLVGCGFTFKDIESAEPWMKVCQIHTRFVVTPSGKLISPV